MEPPKKLKPLIHFTHANGVPSAVYLELFEGLADTFDIIMLPIAGINPKYPITQGWEFLVDEVAESIRSQAKGRPVVALGHSFGGVLSFLTAYKYPELLSGLIMLDPPLLVGFPSFVLMVGKLLGMVDKFTPAGQSKHRRDHWKNRAEVAEKLRHRGLFNAFTQASFDAYIQHAITDAPHGDVTLTIPVSTEVAIFRTIPDKFWLRPRYAPKVPAYLIAGGKSTFDQRGLTKLVQRIQKIPYKVIADGEHMFPLQYPALTANMIKKVATEMGLLSEKG